MILAGVSVADDDELNVFRCDAGCLQRYVFGNSSQSPRRVVNVSSGALQRSTTPHCTRSLVGIIAKLIARLITPMRARPLRARPSSTIARKTCAAGGHEDALWRQLARISLSSRISDWTSVHLCKISPSETRLAASPNGSARGATEDWGEEGLFVGADLMPSGRIVTWMPCRCAPSVLSLTSTVWSEPAIACCCGVFCANSCAIATAIPGYGNAPPSSPGPRRAMRKTKQRMPRRERALSRPKAVFAKRAFNVAPVSV